MKRFPLPLALMALAALIIPAHTRTMAQTQTNSTLATGASAPPVARKITHTTTVHGTTLTDDYFWMRDKKNPEVISYLEAENAYTAAVMKPTEALQDKLYKELLSRIKETDTNVPYPLGGYLYYTRTEQGKQYATFARRKGSMSATEEVLLDLNEMVKGHPFMSVGEFDVSSDTNLLAYSTDSTGYREYTLYVKDLRPGESTKIADRCSSAAWANDNKTLFYVVDHPVNKNPYQLYRHTVGRAGADELVYEEKDEMFGIGVERTRSRGYILLTSASHTTSEVRYVSADRPEDALHLILPREVGHEYYVEHHGDEFFIRTNENGARNFKLVSAPVGDPRRENWKEVIAHRPGVMLDSVDFFRDFYVISERGNATPRLRVVDIKTGKDVDIRVPEPVYTISLGANHEFDTQKVRYNYQSFITPSSVYDS